MTRDDTLRIPVETTGDDPLDDILGGGIPARSVVLIAGEPGSGKTVLTLQMLFAAARRGKKCLYFTTLSEPAIKVIRYMQMFSFFDAKVLDEWITFADLGAAIRQGPDAVFAELSERIERHEPAFVAIDSFRVIGEMLRGRNDLRTFVYDLAVQMSTWGATTFLVGEYTRDEYSQFAEFAIADGILRMGSERHELTSVRQLEVLKLRGAAYSTGRHFFDIDRGGVSFYPRVRAPKDPVAALVIEPGARVATGISGLDALLGGGIPRASATALQGGTGTGKTLLSLQFLVEGARRGERGVMFTLEETPAQLRTSARSMGWDLAALEADGRLLIQYTSPVELSTDRYLNEARRLIADHGATRAVFDSLSTMGLGVASDRRYKEMIYSLVKHLRDGDVTVLMTLEIDQLLGAAELSGHGVSFIADNLIQLRYIEIENHLERAISVLKARGIKHDTGARSYVIETGGITVASEGFANLSGVLTGRPTQPARRDGD